MFEMQQSHVQYGRVATMLVWKSYSTNRDFRWKIREGGKLLEYMLGKTTGGASTFLAKKKWRGKILFSKNKMTGPTLFWRKYDGVETFFCRNLIHPFFVIDAFLSNARYRMYAMIPFLYDLKGAFDSIQMKGQRPFLTGKMTGQTLSLKNKMTGQRLFLRKKMKGKILFSGRKNCVSQAHVPIIFASSLRT